jgi:hypothetical protein
MVSDGLMTYDLFVMQTSSTPAYIFFMTEDILKIDLQFRNAESKYRGASIDIYPGCSNINLSGIQMLRTFPLRIFRQLSSSIMFK